MRAQLGSRLEGLEASPEAAKAPLFRYGWLSAVPQDHVDERHVAVIKNKPTDSRNVEECEFEERAGMGDAEESDDVFTVYGLR
jgi:hypothetical protein